jgi:CubicO group peptidase (beta-lactamase class C family)
VITWKGTFAVFAESCISRIALASSVGACARIFFPVAAAKSLEDHGTRYRYSEGTSVLGRLVEIWSGKPFEVFLQERIFGPLRMTDTVFWAGTPEQRARLTTVYGPAPAGGLTAIEKETFRSPSDRR